MRGSEGQQACGIIWNSMWNNNVNAWKNKNNHMAKENKHMVFAPCMAILWDAE